MLPLQETRGDSTHTHSGVRMSVPAQLLEADDTMPTAASEEVLSQECVKACRRQARSSSVRWLTQTQQQVTCRAAPNQRRHVLLDPQQPSAAAPSPTLLHAPHLRSLQHVEDRRHLL